MDRDMALVAARTEIGARKLGTDVTVPENYVAKLMYYANCMTMVLDLSSEPAIKKLTKWEKHDLLDGNEEADLLLLCESLKPEVLEGKCIFMVDDDQISDANELLELKATETRFVASRNILIGGTQRNVQKIMLYKKIWLQYCYEVPLQQLRAKKAEEQEQIVIEMRGNQPNQAVGGRSPNQDQPMLAAVSMQQLFDDGRRFGQEEQKRISEEEKLRRRGKWCSIL